MPVHRSGPTPAFVDYVSKWALTDAAGALPPAVQQLNPTPLRIPTFQRGISWRDEEVFEFLRSDSVMFGNVVIGMFPQRPGELVDGLQRFATGTLLLYLLYDRVLSAHATNQLAAPQFARLRATVQNFQPVFANNHAALINHPRDAIRRQYEVLTDELNPLLDGLLTPPKLQEFAKQVTETFLDKQVAIDEYWNFNSAIELANTFIGLNTVRVELGTVDLIRAYAVDKAQSCVPAWSSTDVEEAENDITDTFTVDGRLRRELLPAATVVLKCLQSKSSLQPNLIFPNWNTLPKSDVDAFLEFLDQVVACQNPYVREIAESGALPFGIMTLFYYRQRLSTGALPQFLTGGQGNDAELHVFLRATYRALLDATIGRLGPVAEAAIAGAYASLTEVAFAVVPPTSGPNTPGTGGTSPLNAPPDSAWVRSNLVDADSKKARRIFNACLLPDRINAGGTFMPHRYARGAQHWNIDHLIPAKNLISQQPGYHEGNTLRNLAPLPSPNNRVASNTPCSQKLGPALMYANCLTQQQTQHPYIAWLVQNQASQGANLDNQALLEPNANPPIGDARIAAIVALLIPKL